MTWLAKLFAGITLFITSLFGGTQQPTDSTPISPLPIATTSTVVESTTTNPSTLEALNGDVGVIVDNGNGLSTYTSNKYRLSFSYPSSLYVGDTNIGYGTFQLMNYTDASSTQSESFPEGDFKIEMGIGNNIPGYPIINPENSFH
ncbi:hypothetical protein H0X32_02080 [Patescibacteria group bacterium]|nr:hypothetical protein [Patescibacteria group bacterium]